MEKILILAPHTDDGEIGCGGAVARYIEQGAKVTYVAFSAAKKSIPEGFPEGSTGREAKKSTEILGIKDLYLYRYEVRDFPAHRQEILEQMVRVNNLLQPTLVFTPATSDTHQDHQVISAESFRAFKCSTILGYEIPWNNPVFQTNGFIAFEERHLMKKLKSIDCYMSQKTRLYGGLDFIESLAAVRGAQVKQRFAEAFEVIRYICK